MHSRIFQTVTLALTFATCTSLAAQTQGGGTRTKEDAFFNHLYIAGTAGTTGLGVEISMPVSRFLDVRLGGTFMPKFHHNMTFTAQLGDGDQMTEDGLETRFERMAGMLEDLVGQPVDDKVEMVVTPRMNQLKLMADIKPFKDKRWHVSAGFYYGKSRIARAKNVSKEVSSLFAINLYNRLYDNGGVLTNGIALPPDIMHLLLSFGRAGFHTGNYANDVMAYDEEYDEWYVEHEKGSAYLMSASSDNTVYADGFVSRFRPFVGFGFNGNLSKDGRWQLGFDAGVMFWGGAPRLIDHSGVDLMYDVKDIEGQVGDYVDLARHAKAFPVLELKLSHRLF